MMTTTHTAVLAGALLVCSTSAVAQEPLRPRPPVTGAQAMEMLRAKGRLLPVGITLRQLAGPVSRPVQDELADSLVAYVLANPTVTSGARGPVDFIISDLLWSAVAGAAGTSYADSPGTPYAGAGERLLRLAYAVDRKTAGILNVIAKLPDRREALALLQEFASSSHPTAYRAVQHLEMMGPDGIVVLRTLWEQGTVTEPFAEQSIGSIARHHGWTKGAVTSPIRRPPG